MQAQIDLFAPGVSKNDPPTKNLLNRSMKDTRLTSHIIGWIFGTVVFAIGVLNLFLVHPVPAVVYLLLSFIYFPPADAVLRKNWGFSIPLVVKIILGVIIIMFTLGVSDLGDMIDKL
jgi:predicted PurR-regulated permease PerM